MGLLYKLPKRLKGHLSTWPPLLGLRISSSTNRVSILVIIVLVSLCTNVVGEVLTPPYFNIAQGRRISASATCGESTEGYPEREMYCKLVGSTSDTDDPTNVIHGQYCTFCEKEDPLHSHPADYAIDGSERWWQSPPLSRGVKYNEINLTIDLGQEFHVAYVNVRMANSPRPGVWVLERSSDNGETYQPWQYFAENPNECERFFGKESTHPLTQDDSVICDITNSKVVPLENGEIFIRLLEGRPSSHNFFSSDALQEWTRATNVRLRLLRTKTLLGHLMSVTRQDPTVTRRYFYSIKSIEIGGRCRCNGHADICPPDVDDPYKLLCNCQHNTCGPQCETCCPGYVQKAWRVSTNYTPFVCEACNCFGHSKECDYDEEVDRLKYSLDLSGNYDGGGVCKNCRDNTEGINCHKCKSGYFRPYGKALDAIDVCQRCNCDYYYSTGNCEENTGKCECSPAFLAPNCDACNVGYFDYPNCKPCDCHFNGTRGQVCEVGGGQCPCKQNYAGKNCDKCADGFYKFPDCLPCECEDLGSVSPVCDPENGQCECGNNFGGRECNQCENGYYNFPTCTYCNCDVQGTREGICNKRSGECLCREGYGGARCDQCLQGFYGYPECKPCNCSSVGSASTVCDATGKCPCLHNFSGRACDQCTPGFYQYPECLPCTCNDEGSMGVSCDDEGKCQCKLSFDGLRCEECKSGYYNHPLCEECNCDPAGVLETFSGCKDSPPGELCQCRPRVTGRICNECKPLYWNLQQWNPAGCEECDCKGPGILGGIRVCEGKTGQCPCKNNVFSRRCEDCKDGFFNLTAGEIFGCQDCGCDVGGSVNPLCDKDTGQCTCRPRITGLQCKSPLQAHYFPTLYQFQLEAEDGTTPSGGQVRFGYDDDLFPDYSWRGYAVYSQLQPETNHEIYIEKSSLYRVVIRYLNPGSETITGELKATPDSPTDEPQGTKVRFEPNGGFLTVSTGSVPSPFVLNPGRWQFSIKTDQYLLIDYITLLPAAYYEGTILLNSVKEPCMLNTTARGRTNHMIIPDSCAKYKYPSIDTYDVVSAAQGYTLDGSGNRVDITKFYNDKKAMEALGVNKEKMGLLSPQQREVHLDLPITKGGRYALLLEYFTPQGANLTQIQVESTSRKGATNGEVLIHNCKLATMCRQVVTTPDGEVAVFRFDQSSINVVLKAAPNDENGNPGHLDRIAVNSVTAIPLGKWSLDHITPRQFCVVRNGACVNSDYELPPDYVKVEAESGDADRISPEDSMPEGVSNKNLVLLDSQNINVEMSGRVSNPGYYTFLVHYYQPENPEFHAEVLIQNGQHYQAKLPVVHCPSTSGCRAQVAQEDKNTKFYIQDNFLVILKSPKNVWIDYVLAVPADQDTAQQNQLQKYLVQSPLDETRKFIAECGKTHLYIPTNNASDFCRDAVFSLTADYNNGALPCQCDYYGSTAFECNEFGGQCPCKDFVIGRRCERCRTGYFGFPDCKPCDCPSTAFCDPNTGACICPPRVTGDKCDTCAAFTYGFDALIGCEDCACSPVGVEGGNQQCDLLTGHCSCKQNVVGRTCDKCKPGFWAFPYCQMCDCDIRGTTDEICNQESSACHCKPNVEGRGCDQCKAGSFNLQEHNPMGCTSCFCFGKTTRCTQSYLFWTQISFGKSHWTAVTFDPNSKDSRETQTGYEIEFEDLGLSGEDESAFIPLYIPEDTVPRGNENSVLYFRTDVDSNHLASFGGRLTYTLISDPDNAVDRETFPGPDVILEGRELSPSSGVIRLMHFAIDHLDGEHAMRMDLTLAQENFVVASSTGGGLVQATRDQMMIVLKGLKTIYIRAGYWKRTREVKLSAFGVEVATEDYAYRTPEERSVTVEQCQCPPNYQGLSCEECAPGYYRSPSGPFGGFCVPCQCNGHSDICDSVSGICLDCKHNTTGDHCEMCEEGFHGDARGGSPYDCLICACPIPIASNNFATQCELSPNGQEISCTCKDGYIGARCEGCGPGFFGRPEYPGDYCKPCNCSGNIDPTDPYSCDTVTGACLRCMNNTGGPACNLCAQGFYGDALFSKDCRKCSCNTCGTLECENESGDCQCLHNVEGYLCDRCKSDHFGLSRCDGIGCQYCDCGIASESAQCDDLTGQCTCRKGTTGRRCERCAPGYYNYSEEGCLACECNQDYAIGVGCDPETGQCSCLPGVVGEKCDRCPWRWVLIEDRGCQQCDSCQHQLLDVTDQMASILDPVMNEFENVALTYFTTQKLAYYNDTVTQLKPNVQLMDPSKADLSQYYSGVKQLETDAATQRQKAEVLEDSLRDKSKQSMKLRDKSFEVESKVQEAVAKATTTVFETKDLMEGLLAEDKPSSSPQTDAAKAEAEAIIHSMESVKFDPEPAMQENATVTTVLKDMKKFVRPLTKLNKDLKTVGEQIGMTRDKLRDLRNQSDYSITTSKKANEISKKIRDTKFATKLTVLEGKANDMLDNIALATEMNTKSPEILDALELSYIDLDANVASVSEQRGPLAQTLDTLMNELQANEHTVSQSQGHARKLEYEAEDLDAMLGSTRAFSENAVAAATAYKKIISSLNEALEGADQAKDAADNATDIITGLDERASAAMEPSTNLLILAGDSLRQVEDGLKIPLRDAKTSIGDIESVNNITSYSLANFGKELEKLASPRDMSSVQSSIKISNDATNKAQNAQDDVDQILENLPKHSNKLRHLRVTVSDLNSGVGISDDQLKQAKEAIPFSTAITGNLEEKKPGFDTKKSDVAVKLADLKAQIAAAREQANRIPVGMNLQDTSTLLLANPQTLESQQAQTKVSFYFKTQDDGLIFYLGNEPGRKEEDFMSVEIDRGYPVLTLDLGSGPQRIMNEKYVADNTWYKATIDRAGKTVRFNIASEDQFGNIQETPKEDYLQGSKSLFNVDRNSSKLYVGGLPPGVVRSPVRHSTFRGVIEDLTIGDEKVGLWNFKDAQNVAAANERDRFVELQTETGLRFQGNGYAILDRKQFPLKERSAITIRFKTRSKNGLLFLVGKGRKFMSIEMANGTVYFQYDLGGGTASLQTVQMYNDGQWHTVEAVRHRQNSNLIMDGDRERITGVSPGSQIYLSVGDYMYFGGYPGDHGYPSVTTKDFEGCLEQVKIDQAPVDLTQAVESRYTVVGCPTSQFAPTVATFFGQGYLQVSSADSPVTGPVVVTRDDSFEVNFRFRSNDTHGLIFYGTDGDQSNYLSVSMAEGSLYVKTEPGTAQIRTDALNDADWHVVTITRDRTKLVVNIDDSNEYMENATGGPIQLTTSDSILLFGGRPEDYEVREGAIVADSLYSGCLADISINGKRLDFSEAYVKDSSVGQKCLTAQEKQAMALESDSPERNGRTIPKDDGDDGYDESSGGVGIPHTTTTRKKTTTTTTTPSSEYIPGPIDYNLPDIHETGGENELEKKEDNWDVDEDEDEDEDKPKKQPKEGEVTPTPFMQCALPYREAPMDDESDTVSLEDGVMFGNLDKTSRMEFVQQKGDGARSEYSIQFKTSNPDGLLFMWTIFDKPDYIALFMRKGMLHFAFDSGAGPAFLNSTAMFNDTKWHTASVTRFRTQGELTVDGVATATGSSSGSTTDVNAGNTVYVGGLPADGWGKRMTLKKMLNIDTPFKGCLRNFLIRNKSPAAPILRHSVQPCTDQVENGFFFYPNSGYLKLAERFKVGRHIKLSLSIKPRHPSGILVAVHGDRDYMVLQLVNGTVKFTVDSGKGSLSSSYTKNTYDLCDGNWHTIRVTKSKNVVTLALDNTHSNPGIGQAGRDMTNTNHPLYVGGHPDPKNARGIEATEQFVGCMKDFSIENKQFKFNHDAIVGKVGLHSCPRD